MHRRVFLQASVLSVLPLTSCANGDSLSAKTASDAEGPFYPVEPIPLDSSLIISEDYNGDELEFNGSVFSVSAQPLAGSRIEIWQCDGNSVYNHPASSDSASRDSAFRGYGALHCDHDGLFRFRTIVPVAYPGRPPHIHVKLWNGQEELLTTQVYLEDIRSPDSRIISPLAASSQNTTGYIASFDFIV